MKGKSGPDRRMGRATMVDTAGGDALAALAAKLTPAKSLRSAPTPVAPLAIEFSSRATLPPHYQEEQLAQRHLTKAQPKKSKKKQIRLKMPAAYIRAAEIAVPLVDPGQKRQDVPVGSPPDFGRAAFNTLLDMREKLEFFTADHGAPPAIDESSTAIITGRISRGAASLYSVIDPDAEGFLGCDFGTSATKSVVRWPYDPSQLPFAMPVPAAWCSKGSPHLWPSVVYYEEASGRFSALPQPEYRCLEGFKTALVEGRAHRTCCGSAVQVSEAATAFLALYLAYCIGVLTERGAGRLSGINVAVPLAISGVTDPARSLPYRRIVRAAALLIDKADELTINDVRQALADRDGAPLLDFEIWPELSGAIAGYCASPRPHRGDHFILDCGSATFDIASFRLEPGATRPAEIYTTIVETLGADSCLLYQRHGADAADCRKAVEYQDHRSRVETRIGKGGVVAHTGENQRRGEQVILIGGGINGPIHEAVVRQLQNAFERPFHSPDLDPNLQCEEGAVAGRLILADGLARNSIDLTEMVAAVPVTQPDSRMDPRFHDFAERM